MPPKNAKRKASTLNFSNATPSPSTSKRLSDFRPLASPFAAPRPVTRKTNSNGARKENGGDAQLWVDKYEPTSMEELAVHTRKVKDVRNWLAEALDRRPTAKLYKYRRILVLTGPAGTGKTSTLRILSQDMGFEVVAWQNGIDDNVSAQDPSDRESLSNKFRNFLNRASTYGALSFQGTSRQEPQRQQVILIEDIPPISHPATRDAFHLALQTFASNSSRHSCPLVIIVSDSGKRGEARDGQVTWGGMGDEALDIRTVLPKGLISSPYVTEIKFNSIATTILRKTLARLLDQYSSSLPSSSKSLQPSKEALDTIIEGCHGDIRSAIMTLQFACATDLPQELTLSKKGGSKKNGNKKTRALLETVTQREQSLALFHLLGKVLYNKRHGDPEDKDKDPPPNRIQYLPLPVHSVGHQRRVSKVDVNSLYADSPVDTSLFSLYIQQNYIQFCDEVGSQIEGISEALSMSDLIFGANESRANNAVTAAYAFHSLASITLHSLPSPVSRRGQTVRKPEFFDSLNEMRDAEEAREGVRRWLGPQWWTSNQVALEVGGVLNAITDGASDLVPLNHSRFSCLSFSSLNDSAPQPLQSDDALSESDEPETLQGEPCLAAAEAAELTEEGKGWLEDDEIDDF